ncbi:GntR family transcriptional regulator [Lachnotalea glycerini]|uniref:GntR family transcriptional regulator n=1 Tax=Lachnotalea glycerini TaxID=1763509 RepID=A0A371JGQ9_9FIRM|nr:GntR family transcriptional regulator [Lachnotalea glycerini]RDY31919.1 GntR family transcriptional regulator [Lachnotalea glycerini]
MCEKNSDTSLKQQVHDALISDIIKGVYSGETILTEKFLMEKYNVSRAPIREALTQLTTTQILISIPRQGYKIFQPSAEEIYEIVKFRSSLECSFLHNFSFCIVQDWINELRSICEEYMSCGEDNFIGRWHYNCMFHLKLFSIYGNRYAYKQLQDALNIQTIYFIQKKQYASMDLHMALVDYLEKKDIAIAETILKADIENLLIPSASSIDSSNSPN